MVRLEHVALRCVLNGSLWFGDTHSRRRGHHHAGKRPPCPLYPTNDLLWDGPCPGDVEPIGDHLPSRTFRLFYADLRGLGIPVYLRVCRTAKQAEATHPVAALRANVHFVAWRLDHGA